MPKNDDFLLGKASSGNAKLPLDEKDAELVLRVPKADAERVLCVPKKAVGGKGRVGAPSGKPAFNW